MHQEIDVAVFAFAVEFARERRDAEIYVVGVVQGSHRRNFAGPRSSYQHGRLPATAG